MVVPVRSLEVDDRIAAVVIAEAAALPVDPLSSHRHLPGGRERAADLERPGAGVVYGAVELDQQMALAVGELLDLGSERARRRVRDQIGQKVGPGRTPRRPRRVGDDEVPGQDVDACAARDGDGDRVRAVGQPLGVVGNGALGGVARRAREIPRRRGLRLGRCARAGRIVQIEANLGDARVRGREDVDVAADARAVERHRNRAAGRAREHQRVRTGHRNAGLRRRWRSRGGVGDREIARDDVRAAYALGDRRRDRMGAVGQPLRVIGKGCPGRVAGGAGEVPRPRASPS